MFFEAGGLFIRHIYQQGKIYRLNEEQQRALFLKGLQMGAALSSPDELSYFRSGCKLDTPEEANIYYGFSGFFESTHLLLEHRLFATYHGISAIKEGILQILASTLYVLHQAWNTLYSALKLSLSLLLLGGTLGLNSSVRGFVRESAQYTLVHFTKTCFATLLFVSGVIGALVTRPISTWYNSDVSTLTKTEISDERVNQSMKEIKCGDFKRVKQSMFWLAGDKMSKRGKGSRLEAVVGSLSDVADEFDRLSSTKITVDYSAPFNP